MLTNISTTYRLIDGTTQVIAYTSTGTAASTAVGNQTYAVRLSCITGNCLVRINKPGTAASASQGALLKSTDYPVVFLCAPGDKVNIYGLAAGTLYMDELTS